MNQNIWGPHLWFSLHTISFNYPLVPKTEDKEYYKNFFTNLQHVIPCSICKKNYMRHIKEHPITNFLDNRKSMVYWVIDMHNMVNAEIGKKILSYDVVIKKYEEVYKKKIVLNNNIIFNSQNQNLYKEDYKKNYNLINISLIIFIILLIIAFLKTKKII
jgi:hypothetical protein